MRIVLSFMAFIAISTLLQAQPFSLVKDINQTSNTFEGSADRNTEVNGILYFKHLRQPQAKNCGKVMVQMQVLI